MLAALFLIAALQDPPAETPPAEPPAVEEPAVAIEPGLADALTCQTVAGTLGARFGERAATEEGTERDAQIADYLIHLADRARQNARVRARSGMTEAELDAAMAEATTRREAASESGETAQTELERCATLFPAD